MAKAKPPARQTARKVKAQRAAPIATSIVEPPEADGFRTLANRFDSIIASNPRDGETDVRELSATAAMLFKRAVDSGPFAGFQPDFPWPDSAKLFQSEADVDRWAMSWGGVVRAVRCAWPNEAPIEPTAPRFHFAKAMPGVGSIEIGTIAPEDWRRRAKRFASVCLLLASKIKRASVLIHPPLTDRGQEVFQFIRDHGPVSGKEIVNAGHAESQATLTTNIIPELKRRGLVGNRKGAGYFALV